MQQRPMSVTIFGILNIGFGLFDLFLTLVVMVVLPKMSKSDNPIFRQIYEIVSTSPPTPWDVIAAIALVAAGIGLLLLHNWARIVSILYGACTIAKLIVGGILALKGATSLIMTALSLFGTMVTLVYPVLLIIFMMRPKVVAAFKPAPPVA
jgi:hypothetical protein